MGTVWHTVVSVDGFIARPHDDMTWIFDLMTPDDETAREVAASLGALVVGGRTQRVEDRDRPGFYGGAFTGPFFVLRHDPPAEPPVVKGVTGTYVSSGLEHALDLATDAAAGADVGLLGASVGRQALRAGRLDALVVQTVPILLGSGVRLFDDPADSPVRLERVWARPTQGLMSVKYHVVGRPSPHGTSTH